MGLFSAKPSQPTPRADVPAPLSQQRLIDIFDQHGWRYFVDDDGDLGGFWDNCAFYFLQRGKGQEILVVQSRWNQTVDAVRLEEIRVLIDDWNREHWWPKVYRGMNDEGRVQVYCEYAVDLEHGANDAQLGQHLDCAIGTSCQVFRHFQESLDL